MATTYYINADIGDNSNDGLTEATPWLTPAYAGANTVDGDTVIVMDAVNTYPATISSLESVTWQGQRDTAEGAIFDGGGLVIQYQMPVGGSTVTFSGITWQNAKQGSNQMFIRSMGGASVLQTITFNNCRFRNIQVPTAAYYGFIGGDAGSIKMDYTFNKCSFYNMYESGGYLFTGRGTINAVVKHCTFYWSSTTDGVPAYIFYRYAGTYTYISENNIIMNDHATNIPWVGGTIQSASNDYTCTNGNFTGVESGTGNITSDPLFIDKTNEVFTLQATSPCVGTGLKT